MATFHKGNGGKLQISTTNLNITEWTLQKNGRLAEVTHSGSAGAAEWKGTVVEGSGRITAPWDSTQLPDTDAPTMEAGDQVNSVQLYCGDSGKFYQFNMVVETLEVSVNNQTGIVTFNVGYKTTGAITDPVT